jgi:Ni,Fe-hydrogenase III component G
LKKLSEANMNIVEKLKGKFGNKIKDIKLHCDKRIYVEIEKQDIIDFVKFIFHDLDARFITASGIDNLNSMEILYHFSVDREDVIVSIRVFLDRNNPEIDSITKIIKGASNIEREMYELLGIKFLGHPDLKRLLLDDKFPEGVYPLRKTQEKLEK